MTILTEILEKHGGDKIAASIDAALRLMVGDPHVAKAGYSLDNALLAVTDLYSLTEEESEAVRAALGARRTTT